MFLEYYRVFVFLLACSSGRWGEGDRCVFPSRPENAAINVQFGFVFFIVYVVVLKTGNLRIFSMQ